MINYFIIFFSSLLITISVTPYLINYLVKSNIVDKPGEMRRINVISIPRGGGIIVFLVTILAIMEFNNDINFIRFFVPSALMIAAIGLADDILKVKWYTKFITQLIVSIILLFFIFRNFDFVTLFGINFSPAAGSIIILAFIIGVINAFNLMDGLDGLTSGLSLLAVTVIFLIGLDKSDPLLLIISSALIGSLLGFLKFNAYPARIFLGDSGALSLGFFIVVLTIFTGYAPTSSNIDLTFPVIILGVPIVDTLKVMILRIYEGRNPFVADTSHIHHIIYYNNIQHKITVFILLGFSALYSLAGVYYLYYSHTIAICLFAVFSVLLILINPILKLVSPLRPIRNIVPKIRYLQGKFLTLYRLILVPLTFLLLLALIILLFPGSNGISQKYLLIILLMVIISQVISVVENFYNKSYGELFVLINLLIFSSIIGGSSPLIYKFNFDQSAMAHITNIFFYLVSFSFIIFILLKDNLFGKKIAFISGIDLIVFVCITLFIISKSFIGFTKSEFLDPSLLIGFVIFMWYKIFILFNEKYKTALFHFSFIVLDLAIVSMYLNLR
jgi:UDP-GlcNAc:undecaprenyl-phosphate/decaprenyl-phosphate GlcNAc-1-phosphate transferase